MKSKMVSPPTQSLHQWHESLGLRISEERGRKDVSLDCCRQLPAESRGGQGGGIKKQRKTRRHQHEIHECVTLARGWAGSRHGAARILIEARALTALESPRKPDLFRCQEHGGCVSAFRRRCRASWGSIESFLTCVGEDACILVGTKVDCSGKHDESTSSTVSALEMCKSNIPC